MNARRATLLWSLAAAAVSAPAAADQELVVRLDVYGEARPGRIPEAAPPRFVLFSDGQVFVGGTSRVATGRLEKGDFKRIEDRVRKLRRLPGLGSAIQLGAGGGRYRLVLRKGRALEILASGDPASAPSGLRPLAELLGELESFQHPSLRPYRPASYAVRAREGTLDGGCRSWAFSVPLSDALAGAPGVPAVEAEGWPTGAVASAVCALGKRYVVTLRPLIPGERE